MGKPRATAVADEAKVARAFSDSQVEIASFRMDLEGESDRAAVIIAASKLDELLRDLIVARLVPSNTSHDELVDGDRPLSSFSARISIALRLGLIDAEIARSLDLIRKIRNDFAHSARLTSLSSETHIKRVKELVRPFHRDPRFINMFLTERKSRRKPTVKWIVTDEFIACVTLLAVWIRAVTEVVVPLGAKGALHMLVPDEKKSVAK